MSEYIERKTVIEHIKEIPAYFNSSDINYGIELAIQTIKDESTAEDVVGVVRCKDCKYYTMNTELLGNVCNRLFTVFPMKSDDFCSYGERKDEE